MRMRKRRNEEEEEEARHVARHVARLVARRLSHQLQRGRGLGDRVVPSTLGEGRVRSLDVLVRARGVELALVVLNRGNLALDTLDQRCELSIRRVEAARGAQVRERALELALVLARARAPHVRLRAVVARARLVPHEG